MTLNELERTILDESLSDLLAFIQGGIPHLKNTSAEDINQNTLAIASAKMKLKKISAETDMGFTLQEMKVMYWALSDLRDTTLEYLDPAPISDPNRNTAVDSQKICNRLLRALRNLFLEQGIDIQQLFPQNL